MTARTTMLALLKLSTDGITFDIYSLWLFTFSDLKTIVGPSLSFGASNALAASNYGLPSPDFNHQTFTRHMVLRLAFALLWIWLNLLPFTISNQTSPAAIREDAINKPWRVLPSGRMTPRRASRLALALYPLAIGSSLAFGGIRQSLGLVFLGTWYNHFGGGDASCLVRNLINAAGYVCFTSGAMEVTLGFQLPLESRLLSWFGVIAAIIFTTVHLQDMYDQEGDAMRRRKTVPLVVGDGLARWSIAIPMVLWGWLCPDYWTVGTWTTRLSISLAGVVTYRCLCIRNVRGDKNTFKLWNVWMGLVFMLPALGRMQA